jgi:polysaccharide biosynthesis protein PslH
VSGREILFLAHRLPYPPDRGDRIRSWHVLKALAKIAPVHVIAPIDGEEDRQHVAMVESVAASVTTAVRKTSKAGAVIASFVNGAPASVTLFDVPSLRQKTSALLATGKIGAVYAFSGQMAAYVPTETGARFVMDFVDVDSAKFEEQGRAAHSMFGLMLKREAKRLAAFEAQTARRAHASLFVSEAEAALFTRRSGLAASAMGNGIDLAHFAPDAVDPLVPANPLIVFTGQMDYAPNVEAVSDFARKTLPVIHQTVPNARFAIVGRAPTSAVRALASDHVIVTGEVDDTRPWLAGADVVVAPLKLARGVQNKVLEAMAMGKAVVLSPGAAQGIDAEDGRDFVVSEEPSAAVTALLRDAGQRLAMGGAARARMAARYSWDAQLAPLAGFVGL